MKERNPNILSLDQVRSISEALHNRGQSIVLTNGCYDLFHAGHLEGLRDAKKFGDILIVAINDDQAVTHLKGPCRPILPLQMRAELLLALSVVDFVIPFSQDTALEVVQLVRPDTYVKGSDYDPVLTPEGQAVLSYGGIVKQTTFVQGISTTKIIEKIRSCPPCEGSKVD